MLSAQVVREFQTEAAELTREGLLSELRLPAASGGSQRLQSRPVLERKVKSCNQGCASAGPVPRGL